MRRECRRRKRGTWPKTATVERREARVPPALRDAGTPLGARPATLLRANRCRCTGAPVGAPPTPRWGGTSQTPGAIAPRERKRASREWRGYVGWVERLRDPTITRGAPRRWVSHSPRRRA